MEDIEAIIPEAREVLPEAFANRPPGQALPIRPAEAQGARPVEQQPLELPPDTEPLGALRQEIIRRPPGLVLPRLVT